ncbi:hypothetical protein [uncultured Mesonia sp.]|uniref:hypothetical protein n=1 Tax=uncultured Mesonia sp. TaxID=399731 RepID=UPI00374F7956
MKKILFIISFFSLGVWGQNNDKPKVFYNLNDEEIGWQAYFKLKEETNSLNQITATDSTMQYRLIRRENTGTLQPSTFLQLKQYLSALSGKEIRENENIVINYLSRYPEKNQPTGHSSRSKWNIYHKNYLKKLHQLAPIKQFWMHSPTIKTLDYHHANRLNWLADEKDALFILFLKKTVALGNYILIKPDGRYYYYLGEYGKDHVLRQGEDFFKLD